MDENIFEDKASEEFDEQVFGGRSSNQPLTVRVRRIRARGVVVIDWKVEDWPKWENPVVVGRRYDNYVPISMEEVSEKENPSKPIVPGSSQRIGTTGEIRIPTGQTTYFGFWLKGKTLPKPKGLLMPDWEKWSSPEPITFPVDMPLPPDSLGRLRERRDVEYTKNENL
jgi:hypothetical protein